MTRLFIGLLVLFCLVVLPPSPTARAGSLPNGPNLQVTDANLGADGSAESPAIAALGNTVYAVWKDTRDNPVALGGPPYAIYMAKSSDGGATWGTNTRVSDPNWDSTGIDSPSVAVARDGTLYVLWYVSSCYTDVSNVLCGGADRFNDVRLAISSNGGAGFSEVTAWDGDNNVYETEEPRLAVDAVNGNPYILVHEANGSGYDIYLHWVDIQANTAHTLKLSDGASNGRANNFHGPYMSIAARNGLVCTAWEDGRASNAIYGACSTNQGLSFGPNVALSGADGHFPNLVIASDQSVNLSYTQPDGQDINLRRSINNGVNWGPVINMTNLSGPNDASYNWNSLAVDANNMVTLFWQYQNTLVSGVGLYYSTPTNNGQAFAARVLVGSSPTVSIRRNIGLAVVGSGSNSHAVMVWEDNRNTQKQIWSAQAPLDSTPPTAPQSLQATGSDTSVGLTWSGASDQNGILGYHVLRATTSGGPYSQITSLLVPGTTYRDVGLGAGTYYYEVQAVDGAGNRGPASPPASASVAVGTSLSILYGTIAYQAGSNIGLRDFPALSPERTLASGAYPHFSSTGQRVFYLSGTSVSSGNATGGGIQTLYTDSSLAGEGLGVAADNNSFAVVLKQHYVMFGNPVGCDAYEPHYRTLIPAQDVFAETFEAATAPAISPDHHWMAFNNLGHCNSQSVVTISPAELCLVNLISHAIRCPGSDLLNPAFSPGSDWLAFGANFSGQREIWKAHIESDGSLSNLTQLTRSPIGQPSTTPAWSSDGNWLIFQRNVGPGTNWQLFAVRVDGDKLRALGVPGTQPAWYGGGAGPVHYTYIPAVRR